jgi:hypothetical protein
MRIQTFVPAILLMVVASTGATQPQPRNRSAPEMFTANLHATGAKGGAVAATIQIQIQRYTPDADRTAVENALKSGGYPTFLTALRKAPDVGSVSMNGRTWTIRWAREQPRPNGRKIVVVTDQPIYFVGGGSVDAKPREGYEVAVIQMDVDDGGFGSGSMAAAARVKPGGDTGVQIDDYADKPIKIVTVVRKLGAVRPPANSSPSRTWTS